jgi:hypothetical protein
MRDRHDPDCLALACINAVADAYRVGPLTGLILALCVRPDLVRELVLRGHGE